METHVVVPMCVGNFNWKPQRLGNRKSCSIVVVLVRKLDSDDVVRVNHAEHDPIVRNPRNNDVFHGHYVEHCSIVRTLEKDVVVHVDYVENCLVIRNPAGDDVLHVDHVEHSPSVKILGMMS